MKMSIQTRVITAISCIATLSTIALIYTTLAISKYAKMLGINATATYVSVGIAVALIAVLCIICSRMIRTTINKHIVSLKDYTSKIAEGDVSLEIEAPLEDEFIDVYESLQEIVRSNKEDAAIAEAVAGGDLTIKCVPKSPKDLLGHSLANLIKTNNDVLSEINESSYQLTTGAEQVAAASQTLAQGSTEQAAAIEQVTVSMKEIKNMTEHNAEQSGVAQEIVKATKEQAEIGNECMLNMKVAMDEINQSSEKIGKIIKVIDDISFQTNILALNAAVEAARAGQHGKGFAVVAEQIRELAGKSASAAAETADMIDDSISKVHKGTKLADETTKALSTMMEDIEKVVDITESITRASNEQATAVVQIDQAIGQVSSVVQNNSATSEECAAAAEELSGQSFSLRQMINTYKLSGVKADSGSSWNKGQTKTYTSVKTNDDETNPESIISLDGGFGKY